MLLLLALDPLPLPTLLLLLLHTCSGSSLLCPTHVLARPTGTADTGITQAGGSCTLVVLQPPCTHTNRAVNELGTNELMGATMLMCPHRFNIINLLKEDSTYNMGMLPLMHSERSMRSTVRVRAPHTCMFMAMCCMHVPVGACLVACPHPPSSPVLCIRHDYASTLQHLTVQPCTHRGRCAATSTLCLHRVWAGCAAAPRWHMAPTASCAARSRPTSHSPSPWSSRTGRTWCTWRTATPSPGQTSRTTSMHSNRCWPQPQLLLLWRVHTCLACWSAGTPSFHTPGVRCMSSKGTQHTACALPCSAVPSPQHPPAAHQPGHQPGRQRGRPADHHSSTRQGQAAGAAAGGGAVRCVLKSLSELSQTTWHLQLSHVCNCGAAHVLCCDTCVVCCVLSCCVQLVCTLVRPTPPS